MNISRRLALVGIVLLGGLWRAAPAAGAVSASLNAALAYAAPGTSALAFTDWQRIKAAEGLAALNSANTSLDDRAQRFYDVILDRHAPMSAFGISRFVNFAEVWGWDSTDLAWEATYEQKDSAPLVVLQFRAGFDMTKLAARYEAFKFAKEDLGAGVVLNSTALRADTEWSRKTELALANSALDAKQRRLIVSPDAQRVKDALAGVKTKSGRASEASTRRSIAALGNTMGAYWVFAPKNCELTDVPIDKLRLTPAQRDALRKQLLSKTQVGDYLTLAVGYDFVKGKPAGTVVMDYADAARAKADAPARIAAAKDGVSLVVSKPYRDAIFTLSASRIVASTIVLSVRPVDDKPRRLRDMVFRGDMAFASCGTGSS
jgi:hypothetical protein